MLSGGDGADQLFGDRGNDTLAGGRHNDDLFGGQGGDVFVFDTGSMAGEVDRIGDFQRGGDVLRLQGLTVTGIEVRDVGGVDGDRITASSDGIDDTVITLSNGATVQLIGLAVATVDGLLAA
jgi:Ca2+-binding RTX toxin-like protein